MYIAINALKTIISMKKFILFIIVAFSLNAQAGGFIFPNVEYEYAKVYLFNLDLEEPSQMDFRIYKDGVYAKSKLGNGVLLSDEFHTKIRKTFARGIDELIMGLSKCYMPRHGIIYYDANHQPVLSLSICFECDQISIWSKEEYHFSDDYEKFNYDKAEDQMSDLVKIMKNEGFPTYTSMTDEPKYLEYVKTNTALNSQNAVTLNAQEQLAKFPKIIDHEVAKAWAHPSQKLTFKEKIDTVESTSGLSNIYRKVSYRGNTIFHLMDGQLTQANIYHPGFILPLGASIGMSAAEVYQKLGFDIPENGYPKLLNLIGELWTAELVFKYHTLVKVELRAK
jgi:hypothetical protein